MSKYKKNIPLGRMIFIGIFIVVISVISTTFIQWVRLGESLEYHGPNPDTKLIARANEGVASEDSIWGASVAVAPQTAPVIISKQSQDNAKVQLGIKTAEYGIAAGGSLVYLGQNELEQQFKSMKSVGVQWVRWDVDWSVVQKEGSTSYHWEKTDRVAEAAKRYDINSVAIITYTPDWATSSSCKYKPHCEPSDPKEFGRFAGEVVSRYGGSVAYWEIWNEPNYTFFWGPKPDVKKYTEVLKEAYLEIKKVNPSAVVLSGGLASSGDDKNGNISPFTFVSSMYELGASKYFDAVAIHPYTYPASPSYRAWWNRWQEILPIRKTMINNGDEAKRIWITEFGAPTGGPGQPHYYNQLNNFKYDSDYMTEKSQRDLLVDATNFYRQNADWMGPFFWFSLKDRGSKKDDTENFFGLIRYDGSEKPAYQVFKNIIASSTSSVEVIK